MPYFSRLTEIVTCNLSALLAEAADREGCLDQIIFEIQEGITGACRSVGTAERSVERIEQQIGTHREEATNWVTKAREALSASREDQARMALQRKKEIEHLVAGLEQNLAAAVTTRDHLQTTLRALEARLAEAQRRKTSILPATAPVAYTEQVRGTSSGHDVEEELAALRREMGQA